MIFGIDQAKQKEKGTRSFKYAISAFKKLARIAKKNDIVNELESLNTLQTETIQFTEY